MITVYKFGIGHLGGNTQAALDQIYRRHLLRNKLVEIELQNQKEFDALTAHVDRTNLDEAETQLKVLNEAENKEKIDGRSRKTSPEMKASLKELRAKVKALRAYWKDAKKVAREQCKPALEELEKKRREAIKAASTSFNLWWCNYDAVLTDHETSRQRMLTDRKNGRPAEFKFHRFDGQGTLSVRYQTGMAVSELEENTDTRFQLTLPKPDIYQQRRCVRRINSRSYGRIRVGSVGRTPLWLELHDVHVHRQLPAGAVIRQAEVHIQKVAGQHRGSLCLVVAVPDPVMAAHRTDTVAIDIGWRRLKDDRARVAMVGRVEPGKVFTMGHLEHTFHSVKGPSTEVFTPVYTDAQALRDLDQCDRLQAILDEHLNAWKAATGNAMVRSIHRASILARDGRNGKGEVADAHDRYYERYLHLEPWRANLRDQAMVRRTESYRVTVARLLKNAKLVLLEDFDMRGVIANNDTNKFRARCSPSDFRLAVLNYCRREGIEVKHVEAAMSTRKCASCSRQYEWDQARELVHTCLCGATWDQDENAVRNMLQGYQETVAVAEEVVA